MNAVFDLVGCTSAAFWHAFGVSAATCMLAITVMIGFSLYGDWVNGKDVSRKVVYFIIFSFMFALLAGTVGASGTFQGLACPV